MVDLICLDADDTLWHNMRFFAAAEEALVAMLAPFADAGIAREVMAAAELRNLSHYGYGAKSFTLSMIEAAMELGGDALRDSRDTGGGEDLARASGRIVRRDRGDARPARCARAAGARHQG